MVQQNSGKQPTIHGGNRRNRTRLLVFAFFLAVLLVAALESPLTRVRKLTVAGNTSIPFAQVVAASNLHPGMSLWQVNAGRVEQNVLAAEPLAESVTVKDDYLSGTVTLSVREKHVVALFDASGSFYHLLNDGSVYSVANTKAGFPWPIVTVEGSAPVQTGKIPSVAVAEVCRQLASLNATDAKFVSEVHVDRFGIATVYFTNHFAGQCKVQQLASSLSSIQSAIQYFSGKGYGPGLIDMTDGPPYRYTPYPVRSSRKGS